jgi:hypothetical protein
VIGKPVANEARERSLDFLLDAFILLNLLTLILNLFNKFTADRIRQVLKNLLLEWNLLSEISLQKFQKIRPQNHVILNTWDKLKERVIHR